MVQVASKVNKEMSFVELNQLATPSVSALNQGTGTIENGVRVFTLMVLNIVKFFGAEWSEMQVKECGQLCFEAGHYLSFAELSHFAKKAKSGQFEKVYGKFSPITFMAWFNAYLGENLVEREMYYANQKTAFIEPENMVEPEKVFTALKNFSEQLESDINLAHAAELVRQSDEKAKQIEKLRATLPPDAVQSLDEEIRQSQIAIDRWNDMVKQNAESANKKGL